MKGSFYYPKTQKTLEKTAALTGPQRHACGSGAGRACDAAAQWQAGLEGRLEARHRVQRHPLVPTALCVDAAQLVG